MNPKMKSEFPLINAVLNDKCYGHVYDIQDILFVVHQSGFSEVLNFQEKYLHHLLEFWAEEDTLPQYFHVYTPPEVIAKKLQNDDRFGMKYRERIQLRYRTKKMPEPVQKKQSEQVRLDQVTTQNINDTTVFELNFPQQFWQNQSDFLENGLGVMAYENQTPVSFCYSSAIADHIAEVDIATLAQYQGKGYAKATTREFIALCLQHNIKVNWDCFTDNTPSLKTAIALGFEQLQEYMFLSVYNKLRDNEKTKY